MIFHPLIRFLLLVSLTLAFGNPTGPESVGEEAATSALPVADHSSGPESNEEKDATRPPLSVTDHTPEQEKIEESTEKSSEEVTERPTTTLSSDESKRLVNQLHT